MRQGAFSKGGLATLFLLRYVFHLQSNGIHAISISECRRVPRGNSIEQLSGLEAPVQLLRHCRILPTRTRPGRRRIHQPRATHARLQGQSNDAQPHARGNQSQQLLGPKVERVGTCRHEARGVQAGVQIFLVVGIGVVGGLVGKIAQMLPKQR